MMQQKGRSMVEMLGVLAIIAVLSAGGLAGYSRAMKQHKLNLHKTSFDMLLLNAVTLLDKTEDQPIQNASSLFYQLNLVPEHMTYQDNYIYDIFKNRIRIYYNQYSYYKGGISLNFKNANENIGACANMVQSAQELSSEIWMLERTQEGSSTGYGARLFGDKFCTPSVTCLKNLTKQDMINICTYQSDNRDNFSFYILWGRV